MIARNVLRPILLHTARRQNISFLKKQINSGSIYRAVGIVASIQVASTLVGTYWIDRNITLTLQDYFDNQFLKENQKFQIVGFIKEGSISIKRGSLETKFVLTDYDKEYDGRTS